MKYFLLGLLLSLPLTRTYAEDGKDSCGFLSIKVKVALKTKELTKSKYGHLFSYEEEPAKWRKVFAYYESLKEELRGTNCEEKKAEALALLQTYHKGLKQCPEAVNEFIQRPQEMNQDMNAEQLSGMMSENVYWLNEYEISCYRKKVYECLDKICNNSNENDCYTKKYSRCDTDKRGLD